MVCLNRYRNGCCLRFTFTLVFWRRESESNRRTRLCRPLHNHFAIPPNWLLADCIGQIAETWSGKRVSNSRPQPWQGCALPTELFPHVNTVFWSGKRVSNSRPQPWQGCALPTELFPLCLCAKSKEAAIIATSVFVSSWFVKLFEFVPSHFKVVTHRPNGEHGSDEH